MSGGFHAAFRSLFPRRAAAADVVPRVRGPIAWERPEPLLFRLDGRRDYLLKLDATLVNRSARALDILEADVAGTPAIWDAPRVEWMENDSIRRAVFRVEPWLPCTLDAGTRRGQVRLLFVVPRDRVASRGTARLPLVLHGDPFGTLRFEVRAEAPGDV
ncbi:MAG: hypothetical protein ACREOU_10270 [Candidatus Eiseniibacteriota bacterium]